MSARIFAALATATALASCQPIFAIEKPHPNNKPGVLESISIDRSVDCLLVPVQLQGKSYRFILDTGCTVTIFDPALRKYLGKPSGHATMRLSVGEAQVEVYSACEAKLGSLSLPTDGMIACWDTGWIGQVFGRDIDGILGNTMLRNWIVRLDFDNGRIDILDRTQCDTSTWGEPVPFLYDAIGWMRVIANVGVGSDREVRLIVDTGHDGTLGLARDTFSKACESGDVLPTRMVKVGTAARAETVREGTLSGLAIGPFRHRSLWVEEKDDNFLGLSYLKRFQVTFDFPNRMMYLAMGRRYSAPEEPADRSGLHLLRTTGEVLVACVDSDSPSNLAGIRAGDRIVRVEGKPANEIQLTEIRRILKAPVGTVVHISIQRGIKTADVQFRLQELSVLMAEMRRGPTREVLSAEQRH